VFKKRLIIPFLITFIFSIFSPITITTSSAAQTACVIGSSASCPATSPQEIYNLYGTTTDGTYYLKVNGTATQVYLLMNRTGSDNGAWILLMKGTKGTNNFGYTSSYFTDNSTTLNTNSLANDVTTDAKFSVYNDLSLSKMLAVLTNPTNGTISSNGDIQSNAFGGHVWLETLPSTSTAYSRLTTTLSRNSPANSSYTSVPKTKYFTSSTGTQVFSYQAGYGQYGFNSDVCAGTSYRYRWGISWNQESDWATCDVVVGIGLGANSPGDQVRWSGVVNGSVTSNTGHGDTGFQIWGKVADPSLGNVQSLSTTITGTTASLSWQAPTGVTPTDYVVQYKSDGASSWPTSNTFLITGQTTAAITGLTVGDSYNFRVIARTANDSTASASSITPINIAISTITNKLQIRGSTTASATVSTGSLSYSAAGACTVNSSSGAVTFTSTGNCTITATAASSPNPTASTTFEIVPNLTQKIISRTGVQPASLSSFIPPPYLTTARSENSYACLDIVGASEATVLTSTNLNISLNLISGASMVSSNAGKSYTITGTLAQVQAALSNLKINSSSGRIMAANAGSIYLRVRANLIADATTDAQCLDIGNDGRIQLYQYTSDQIRRKNVPQKSGSAP
jgi:Fibronectin type III domain